jgi:hypothetical protein
VGISSLGAAMRSFYAYEPWTKLPGPSTWNLVDMTVERTGDAVCPKSWRNQQLFLHVFTVVACCLLGFFCRILPWLVACKTLKKGESILGTT